jgi:hypothetical protein
VLRFEPTAAEESAGFNPLGEIRVGTELTFRDGRQLPANRHRLLLIVDEMPSYGRLDVFQESLAYIAGYGIKAYLIGGAFGRGRRVARRLSSRSGSDPGRCRGRHLQPQVADVFRDERPAGRSAPRHPG